MKVLFAISSLWLWHTTRTIVIIKHFLEKGYNITIISHWNALQFLENELKDKNIKFIEYDEYPALERWRWIKFYYYLLKDVFKARETIKKEREFLKNIENGYDFIFSDWKYWFYSKNIPSFMLIHQVSFILPTFLKPLKIITNHLNYKYCKNFSKIFIPDYEDSNYNLWWDLSHPSFLKNLNYKFTWILSSYKDTKEKVDIDYLFIISWYLLEHKDTFINKLINESKPIPGKKVFILWDTSEYYKKEIEKYDITIYSFASWDRRKRLFSKAKCIVSRTGYTTIMDIVELWKKAILFPTKNQTEQEYLAKYLKKNNLYVIWNDNSNLRHLVAEIPWSRIFEIWNKTKTALEIIDKEIEKYF